MGVARKNAFQMTHYVRFKVNYNDAATGVAVNKSAYIPAGAVILRATIAVGTAFNAATTNTLSLGTVGDSATNIVNAQSVSSAGHTVATAPTGAAQGRITADKQIQATYSQTGTAATAGAAYVVIEYVVDNDENYGV